MKIFSANAILDSIKNIVKDLPFLIIHTNEISQENNKFYISKYYFSSGYNNNPYERKIIGVSVADDKIEEIKIFNGLFNNKNKLLFLEGFNLDNSDNNVEIFPSYFYGKDIGYFLQILGPSLHITDFSKGQIILTYSDISKCPHNFIQNVSFLLFFDKNYNFHHCNVLKNSICNSCLNNKKVYSNFNSFLVSKQKMALRFINFNGDLDYFYRCHNLHLQEKYYRIMNNFKLDSLRLVGYEEAMNYSKDIFNDNNYKFNYPWDHYQDLIDLLFINEEYVNINDVAKIFDESTYYSNEFLIKDNKKN
jgi:hypothetical protein